MIPDDVVDQVRDAADLVEIVGESVGLRRTGSDYRGPCPFHGGRGRNFAVIPKKGIYYCFVCHEGGDVFTWYMKRHGLDYPTAVREVARRVGIVIPESGPQPGPDPREPLYQAVAVAQEFFAAQLRESTEGAAARDYLAAREIPLTWAVERGLGYAPRGRQFLDEMEKLGLPSEVLLAAGLLHRRDDDTLAPRFRGRLLFPIHDLRGRVVGFGGRLLGPGEPKYLNSPESDIFHKGRLLYHLHLAKQAIRVQESVIIVEGYFDVLRLELAGLEHVVAPLGTALTGDQAAVLRRFAKTAIVCYDSDRAGLRATFRAGDELLRHGVRVRVVSLPPGEDPDTLVRRGGAAALEPLLHDAVDLLERKLQLLEERGWFADLSHRREALDRILPTLAAASDPMIRDLYVGRVAERVGVSRETLERELRDRLVPKTSPAAGPPPLIPPPPPGFPAEPRRPPRRPFGSRAEVALLRLLLASAEWRSRARKEVAPDLFAGPQMRALFTALMALPPSAKPEEAVATLPDELVPAFQKLCRSAAALAAAPGPQLDREYEGAVDQLREWQEFRRVELVPDVGERRRIMESWSPVRRRRYGFFRAAQRARRLRRPEHLSGESG
jgi:DNA primase